MQTPHYSIIVISLIALSFLTLHQVFAPCAEGVSCGDIRPIPTPLKQLQLGTEPKDVLCHDGFLLVMKTEDGSPACVKPQTAQKLLERGWGVISVPATPAKPMPSPDSSNNKNETNTGPVQIVPVTNGLSDTSNAFGFSLFSNILQNDTGNVFFSPYSISNAFSMVYEGSGGSTKDEIQSVFHFNKNDTSRRESVKAIDSELNNPNEKFKLSIANALWLQKDFPVLKDYTDTLGKYYSALATNLDFKTKADDSRQIINSWVENKTNQKIKDLFPPGSLDYTTRAVLTNAIYFKGNWTYQFNENQTKDDDFHVTDKQTVKVPMMTTKSNFKYLSDNDLQILEMPYQGGNLSMIVLLPKENNLKSLTNSISAEKLNGWKSKLTPEQVTVYMPKFTLNTKYILNDNLVFMGMPTAFSPNNANFSGITDIRVHPLFISIVIHQAFVKVDEKGTEAAAATGIGMSEATSVGPPPIVFRADHPFMFLIYDNHTGLILFMGQVVDPSTK